MQKINRIAFREQESVFSLWAISFVAAVFGFFMNLSSNVAFSGVRNIWGIVFIICATAARRVIPLHKQRNV